MPRGGARIGAGRKPKDPSKPRRIRKKAVRTAESTQLAPSMTMAEPPEDLPSNTLTNVVVELQPLDYMLLVINDKTATQDRRDRLAIAAAPFVHGKVAEAGIKTVRTTAAKKASAGKFAPSAAPKLVVNNK